MTCMINVVVADDELPAVAELAYLLSLDSRVGTIHRANSGAEALKALEEFEVDALFLDIHMPALSGLDIARVISRFTRPPAVVFVTADEDQALEAFELAAVDYVLKPVRPERLAESVRRICELAEEDTVKPDMVTVEKGGITKMIRRDEILYVQAQGDYARLHTKDASYLIRVPLNDLEQQWGRQATCASTAPTWCPWTRSTPSSWPPARPWFSSAAPSSRSRAAPCPTCARSWPRIESGRCERIRRRRRAAARIPRSAPGPGSR